MKLYYILLFTISLTSISFAKLEYRNWTSKAGTSIKAALVKLDSDFAHLKKQDDGIVIKVSLKQLNEKDISFLQTSPFWHSKGYLYSEKPGVIIVLDLAGSVNCHNLSLDSSVSLKSGSKITEQHKITTGSDGVVTLLFSNGSTTKINESSEFIIEEFIQERIENKEQPAQNNKEFSASRSRLKLNYGSIFSNIQKLENRSAYTIQTSVGAAGIRGTDIFLKQRGDETEFSVVDGLADFWMPSEGIVSVGNDRSLKLSGDSVHVEPISESRKSLINSEKSIASTLKTKISFNEMIKAMEELEEQTKLDQYIEEAAFKKMDIRTSRDLESWLIGTTWELKGKGSHPTERPQHQMQKPPLEDRGMKGKMRPPMEKQMSTNLIVFSDAEFAQFRMDKFLYEVKSKNKVFLYSRGMRDKGKAKLKKVYEIRFSDDYRTITIENLIHKEEITAQLKSQG